MNPITTTSNPWTTFLAVALAAVGLCGTASANAVFTQTANNTSFSSSADDSDTKGVFQLADDVTLATTATIRSVKWWGGYGPFANTPVPPFSFQLIFYGDSGGLPDRSHVLSSTAVQFTSLTPVGEVLGNTNICEFRSNITPTPIPADTKVWFSVLATTANNPAGDFLWRGDELGNCARRKDLTSAFVSVTNERPMFILDDEPVRPVTTIYADDFSGAAVLNGSVPDLRPGAETWSASSNWQGNGTITSVNSTTADDSAFLPFSPLPGKIYTLSATLKQPVGGASSSAWAGIGFSAANNIGSYPAIPNNPSPWMSLSSSGQIKTLTGPGTAGSVTESTYPGLRTIKIVLDTTAPDWTAEWFVGLISLRKVIFPTHPTITYVGLAREDGVAADFDAFSLMVEDGDVVPRIVSFSSVGGNLWELSLAANPGMPFEFRSAANLVFNPGILVVNLSQGNPGDPGTIGGPNGSAVTTDANGNAKVRMTLTNQPRAFVRAVSLP